MLILKGIKNIIFPSMCLCCKGFSQQQTPLCKQCIESLKICGFIPKAEKYITLYKPHGSILNLTIFSCFLYTSAARELLHNFKYNIHYIYLGKFIFELLKDTVKERALNLEKNYDYITYVPMHKSKLKERDFNHANVISKLISNYFNIPHIPNLLYVRKPYPLQSHQRMANRIKNPVNRISLNRNLANKIYNKHIILFDDILTTGSTISSCLRELNKAKPKKMLILTFAKA